MFTIDTTEWYVIPFGFGNAYSQFFDVKRTANGKEITVSCQVYMSSFWKSAMICDKQGNQTGLVMKAEGTAVEEIQKLTSIQEVIAFLKDKTIKVSDVRKGLIFNQFTGRIRNTAFYTFDLA